MVMHFWWLGLILAAVGAAVLIVAAVRRPRRGAGSAPIAYSSRVTSLPSWIRARRRLLLGSAAALAVVGLVGASALAGASRPAEVRVESPEKSMRDVILCLDASGSMVGYDAEVVAAYIDMLDDFEGERLGLVVFNATAVTVFPLTDDYDMVREVLREAEEDFANYGTDFIAGTSDTSIAGSSLIGDGLVSCVDAFDRKDQERSRSIIFATDNMVAGAPLFEVPEAADIAAEEGVRVYPLSPPFGFGPSVRELDDAAKTTGGEHHELGALTSTDRIVESIQRTEAALTDDDPFTLVLDRSAGPLAVAGVLIVVFLVLAWRLKL